MIRAALHFHYVVPFSPIFSWAIELLDLANEAYSNSKLAPLSAFMQDQQSLVLHECQLIMLIYFLPP